MAQLNEKFTEVRGLILTHPAQARSECVNGVNICVTAKGEFETIKAKLIDKFGEDELITVDLQGAINSYFNT